MNTDTQQYSEEVLDILRTEGWVQGRTQTPAGRCLVGASLAVWKNYHALDVDTGIWERWQSELMDLLGGQWMSVFNDDPATTFEDVALLLKRHIHQGGDHV